MRKFTLIKDYAARLLHNDTDPYTLYDEEGGIVDSFESVKAARHQIETLLREAKEEIESHVEELVAALDETRAYEEFLQQAGNL